MRATPLAAFVVAFDVAGGLAVHAFGVAGGELVLAELLGLAGQAGGEALEFGVVAGSKSRKSWLVLDLALSMVVGNSWLGAFPAEPGRVLLVDNELHAATTISRLRQIMQARNLGPEDIVGRLHLEFLRGRLRDLHGILNDLAKQPPGTYQLVILDAWYRTLPVGLDENDNGAVAGLYNAIDALAGRQGCAFVLVHHTSKGNQAGKTLTDVGAGAGSQARAADAHLTLRPHRETDVCVLDGVLRSWPPMEPLCLRWQLPLWTPDCSLDPADLDTGRARRRTAAGSESTAPKPLTVEALVAACVADEPRSQAAIIERAMALGCSERRVQRLLTIAREQDAIHRWPGGMLATTEPPEESTEPATRREAVLAILNAEPALPATTIAARCGVTAQYVRRVRRENESRRESEDESGRESRPGGSS